MAEALSDETKTAAAQVKGDSNECAVCLQPWVHPARLPCGHIFCYLCVKGFANQSKKCAMCRQEIPRDFIEQPSLLESPTSVTNGEGFDGGYQWFYEGRNGWWQYDERTSKELEYFYKQGDKTCELLIAGFLYIIDLENMLQLRRNDPSRRRRVKRDHDTIPKKGVAGLRTEEPNCPLADSLTVTSTSAATDLSEAATPLNPQTPVEAESQDPSHELEETIERISNIRLDLNENTSL